MFKTSFFNKLGVLYQDSLNGWRFNNMAFRAYFTVAHTVQSTCAVANALLCKAPATLGSGHGVGVHSLLHLMVDLPALLCLQALCCFGCSTHVLWLGWLIYGVRHDRAASAAKHLDPAAAVFKCHSAASPCSWAAAACLTPDGLA